MLVVDVSLCHWTIATHVVWMCVFFQVSRSLEWVVVNGWYLMNIIFNYCESERNLQFWQDCKHFCANWQTVSTALGGSMRQHAGPEQELFDWHVHGQSCQWWQVVDCNSELFDSWTHTRRCRSLFFSDLVHCSPSSPFWTSRGFGGTVAGEDAELFVMTDVSRGYICHDCMFKSKYSPGLSESPAQKR